MKIPAMIAAEFRRLSATKMAVIALIALLAVPIVYAGLYLWANQDPYGRLDQVPVALVVNDEGATINGTDRNVGDEVADSLLEDGSFDWSRVSAAEATAGLDDGTYDFAVELPADFSDAIASITSASPRQAELILQTNDANNYLASTIGSQAVQRIQTSVGKKIASEAGITLLDALNSIRTKLVDAKEGADQLVSGLADARSGGEQLSSGSKDLASGLETLSSGAATLAEGTSSLADGSAQLASGLDDLANNSRTLADGAAQVADGTAELQSAADRVGTASSDAAALLPDARADISALLTEQGLSADQVNAVLNRLDPLADRLQSANERVQSVVSEIDTLNSGAQQVSAGSARLADGASTAASSAHTLADGAAQVNSGAASVSSGAADAATGADTLHSGAVSLTDGLKKLESGAQELRDGLADGVSQLPNTDEATRKAQAAAISDPVKISDENLSAAENYGAGLAPFFAALAGWIGIYALFLIVKPVSKRAVTALRSPIRVAIAGWATPTLLGMVQMVGLFAVLAWALGFSFSNPIATLGILLFATATYAAIVLALNVWLGSVGQFIGLVLMVLQLVTAGGTFPWQTLPAPLAALHHVLPMGYVVDAMRQVMYGGGLGRVWLDLAVLGWWLAGALILAIIGVTRMTHRRTLRDLQPSLIG